MIGYSMGAHVAFELVKLMEANGLMVKLFLPDKNVKKFAYQRGSLHANNESINTSFRKEIGPW